MSSASPSTIWPRSARWSSSPGARRQAFEARRSRASTRDEEAAPTRAGNEGSEMTNRKGLACLLTLIVAMPLPIQAQPGGSPTPFKTEQLDQLAAPIALYPDPLVAQVLMASTYPLEIVQAARFARDNPSLKGDQLNEALKQQTWDDSVKSLVSFPQVLTMMDQKLDWTQKLGDAFLAEQKELMDAIQRLRARAQAEGNLKSTAEQKVIVEPAAAPPPPPVP